MHKIVSCVVMVWVAVLTGFDEYRWNCCKVSSGHTDVQSDNLKCRPTKKAVH